MQQKDILIFIIVVSITIAIFITAIVIFIAFYRKRLIATQQEKETILITHQQELLATKIEIQSQTMQEIGREIHDNIGQKLTLASIHIQQLEHQNQYPIILDKITNINQIINQSLIELRALSKTLTDDLVDKTNIVDLLKKECNKINKLKVCKVEYLSNAKELNLDYKTKSILYRLTQEFLQNSIKHAGCDKVIVNLNFDGDCLTLNLSDNGKGFKIEENSNKGIGLINMKKRAALIGASYNLKSNENGTVLTVKIKI